MSLAAEIADKGIPSPMKRMTFLADFFLAGSRTVQCATVVWPLK
jgi:hypothetical protein